MKSTLKNNSTEFQQEIKSRGINSLVHFTPTLNLMGIFELGKIVNRAELERIGQNHVDYLLDYTQMTDDYRFDDPSYINLSIEHPNSFLLKKFQQKTTNSAHIQWCVILLDVSPIFWKGTKFSVTNAASNAAKNYGIGTSIQHFKNMFRNSLTVKNRTLTRYNLPSQYPTDVQAEVLVKEEIALNNIQKIVFQNDNDLLLAKGAVKELANFDLEINEHLFRRRSN